MEVETLFSSHVDWDLSESYPTLSFDLDDLSSLSRSLSADISCEACDGPTFSFDDTSSSGSDGLTSSLDDLVSGHHITTVDQTETTIHESGDPNESAEDLFARLFSDDTVSSSLSLSYDSPLSELSTMQSEQEESFNDWWESNNASTRVLQQQRRRYLAQRSSLYSQIDVEEVVREKDEHEQQVVAVDYQSVAETATRPFSGTKKRSRLNLWCAEEFSYDSDDDRPPSKRHRSLNADH